MAEIKAKLDRFNEVAELGDPDADYDELMDEMGKLQEELDHPTRGTSTPSSSRRWTRCAARRRTPRHGPLRWREAPRRAVQAAAAEPDLLLLDEPTNHLDAESVLWLEQHLAKYPGAILAVTHDRYFLDNVAEWILELDRGRAYPYEGNYSTYLEKKAERLDGRGRQGREAAEAARPTNSPGCAPDAKARQTKSHARLERYEEMAAEAEKTRKLDFEEIQIPPGPRLGNIVVEVKHLDKGFDGRAPDQGPVVHAAAQRHRRRHRPQRRRQDHAVQDDRGGPRAAATTRRRTPAMVGETVKLSYVDQNRGGIDPKKNVWEVVSDGLDYIKVGQIEMPSRAYVVGVRLQGPRPAEAGRRAVRRRAQPAQPGADPQEGRQPDPARRADQRPRRRDARLAGERAAGVPRLRRGHLPRPLVPRPTWHAHPGVGGRRATRPSGSGSRATSSRTRRTRSSDSAPRRPVRTG